MPLDARKLAHLQTRVIQSWASRQKTVTFVYLVSGSLLYTAVSVIMKSQAVLDPEVFDASGKTPLRAADVIVIAPLSLSFTGLVYLADTPTATQAGVAAAPKYELIEALNVGVAPGGSHIRALFRRMR